MTDRIEQIIAKALLQPCDNHRERAELARETARQVMEAKYRPLYRLSADGKVEPVPSYEDGVKEGLRRAAKIADDWQEIEKLLPLCGPDENAAARVGQSEAAERIHDLILSLLTKEEGQ